MREITVRKHIRKKPTGGLTSVKRHTRRLGQKTPEFMSIDKYEYVPEKRVTADTSEPVFLYRKGSQQLVDMSPDTFLDVVTEPVSWSQASLDYFKEKLIKGEPIEPLYIDIDTETGEVLAHEGRHRAKVAQQLGFKTVPVIIFHKKYDPDATVWGVKGSHFFTDNWKPINPKELKKQKVIR